VHIAIRQMVLRLDPLLASPVVPASGRTVAPLPGRPRTAVSLCVCRRRRPGATSMADADDVRRLALARPHVVEIDSDGFDFRVADKGFV
jgi:hypothetical protein